MVGVTAVTFTTAVMTPVAGSSALPVACTSLDSPAASGPDPPIGTRLSTSRAGVTGTVPPGSTTVPAVKNPARSATTSVAPTDPFRNEIFPFAPTLASTRLGTTCPAVKLRFDAVGAAPPAGKTVRYPAAFGDTTVTLSMTVLTAVGTGPIPVTVRSRTPRGPIGPPPPDDTRVSSTRVGDRAVKAPGAFGQDTVRTTGTSPTSCAPRRGTCRRRAAAGTGCSSSRCRLPVEYSGVPGVTWNLMVIPETSVL